MGEVLIVDKRPLTPLEERVLAKIGETVNSIWDIRRGKILKSRKVSELVTRPFRIIIMMMMIKRLYKKMLIFSLSCLSQRLLGELDLYHPTGSRNERVRLPRPV